MKRAIFACAALGLVAACDPTLPDSGAGVGFGDYNEYEANRLNREAQLQGRAPATGPLTATAQPVPTTTLPATTTGTQAVSSSELASAGIGATTPTTPTSVATGQAANLEGGEGRLEASPSNPAPLPVQNRGGISNEQDFGAVSGQRDIQGDAALRQQNAANYTVIQPTAIPTREGGSAPNIVQYALNTTNNVGQQIHSRSAFSTERKFLRNCATYASPDIAQQDFLARGGPARDRLGIDPDGDGFACAWDPRPFRASVQN